MGTDNASGELRQYAMTTMATCVMRSARMERRQGWNPVVVVMVLGKSNHEENKMEGEEKKRKSGEEEGRMQEKAKNAI